MQKTRPPQGAQAALRAIRLLKLFTEDRPELSLAELSKASGLNKTTTHRLLRALQSESLVERNAGTSQYSLGPGLMALGVQALADLGREDEAIALAGQLLGTAERDALARAVRLTWPRGCAQARPFLVSLVALGDPAAERLLAQCDG